jgi:hypothetical protein
VELTSSLQAARICVEVGASIFSLNPLSESQQYPLIHSRRDFLPILYLDEKKDYNLLKYKRERIGHAYCEKKTVLQNN